jgi:hypothetical protein
VDHRWRVAYGVIGGLKCAMLAMRGEWLASLRAGDLALIVCGPEEGRTLREFLSKVHGAAVAQVAMPEGPRLLDERVIVAAPRLEAAEAVKVLETPSLVQFVKEALLPRRPVLIRGALRHWEVCDRWRDVRFLVRTAGYRFVPVEMGRSYMAQDWSQTIMPFVQFLHSAFPEETAPFLDMGTSSPSAASEAPMRPPKRPRPREDDDQSSVESDPGPQVAYLAQHALLDQVPELGTCDPPEYCDVTVGASGECVPSEAPPRVNVWIGPANTVSDMHTDPDDNLLCQVCGTKRVLLLPPEAAVFLDPHDGMMSNTATVDPREERVATTAARFGMPLVEAVMSRGDALFIPRGWWHHVQSLSKSASVSLWWH